MSICYAVFTPPSESSERHLHDGYETFLPMNHMDRNTLVRWITSVYIVKAKEMGQSKKVISGLGKSTEIASSAALPYPSFCATVVVTKNCISENHEALSSIFHAQHIHAAVLAYIC